ncbi:MAG: DUF2867 domain-containing protein, partial [Desulfobacteraceae bacterium]|nr:DUF2867 domain-containing protein [Desulfobacteraceae bacterium]
ADLLWKIRGILDVFSGGVGLQRGRRSQHTLQVGDALDFWRVLEVDKPHRLLLVAEMKLPGQALLEIFITPQGPNRCELTLLSRFLPRGLFGMAYWYVLYPFHQYVFAKMLTGMAAAAGKTLLTPPRRYTPKITNACSLPEDRALHSKQKHPEE